MTVVRYEGRSLDDGLGDEQVIEWIFVVRGQRAEVDEVGCVDGKQLERLPLDFSENVFNIGDELACSHLDLHLPKRDDGHEDVVRRVGDELSRRLPKSSVVCKPPKEGMGVEEEPHAPSLSIAASMSIGSISKSGVIWILPRRAPGSRRGRE